MHVSITRLRLTSIRAMPRFWWHAVRSMAAARAAPGIRHVSARRIGGHHCTLTAWETRHDMLGFLRSPAHRAAMRVFPEIATGRTLGFDADTLPAWDTALARLDAEGRDHAAPRT